MNLNKVYLLGQVDRDPESRDTHSGSTVVRVVLAISRDYFSKERNQRVRETDKIEVQAWGRSGELLAQQVKKGGQIFIEGRLKLDTWETPTGEKRQRVVVHLENFAPIGPGQRVNLPAGAMAQVGGSDEAAVEEAMSGPTPTSGPGRAPGGSGRGPRPEGAPGAEGEAGASGKRKRRRRRGPRRDGIPAGPAIPMTPEEQAAFSAGLTDAATPPVGGTTSPTPSPEAPAPGTQPTRVEAAAPPPPPPAPTPPPAPPAPPVERKPQVSNTSLKEDMPF